MRYARVIPAGRCGNGGLPGLPFLARPWPACGVIDEGEFRELGHEGFSEH